jgi:Nucleotidyl transferase AbiEii toxin, Type IV TA system
MVHAELQGDLTAVAPAAHDGDGFPLLGDPRESVIAEKAITLLSLGDTNTRDRDYADVYLLSRVHPIEAAAMRAALRAVAAWSAAGHLRGRASEPSDPHRRTRHRSQPGHLPHGNPDESRVTQAIEKPRRGGASP